MADMTIDAVGLLCPMPIAKVSAGIQALSSGQILEVTADDPAFKEDVKAFCRVSGHTLEDCIEEQSGIIRVVIRIK